MRFRSVFLGGALGSLALLCACAKFPSGASTDATRLVFRFTVSREIRDDYVYVVAIQP